jgi:hypothetical protein
MLIKGYKCVFVPGFRGNQNRVIVMGLYPPPGSESGKQHNNRTSNEIHKVIKNDLYDWVDLYTTAPYKGTTCDQVDLEALHNEIVNRSPEAKKLTLVWGKRMQWLVDRERSHDNNSPTVMWCGDTVNLARQWLHEMTGDNLTTICVFKTPWFTVNKTTQYQSIENAVHPSHHLQARGEKTARQLFKITYGSMEELRQRPYETINELIAALDESVEEERTAMIRALDKLEIPHEEGWLTLKMRHLRSIDWSDKELVATLLQFTNTEMYQALDGVSEVCADLKKIAKRLQRDCKAIAKRLQSDCKAIAKRL